MLAFPFPRLQQRQAGLFINDNTVKVTTQIKNKSRSWGLKKFGFFFVFLAKHRSRSVHREFFVPTKAFLGWVIFSVGKPHLMNPIGNHATVTKTAFTLIELLCVVTVIAILAAIAVPNLLEAQVKSKIARVRADHRTLCGALEAYALDNNRYIDSKSGGVIPFGSNPTPRFAQSNYPSKTLPLLSTPIAYLSRSILDDPFDTGTTPPFFYCYVNTKIVQPSDLVDLGISETDSVMIAPAVQEHGYMVTSLGPDSYSYIKNPDNDPEQGIAQALAYLASPSGGIGTNVLYDPSNGTVSLGELLRTGKGSLN